MRMMDELTLHGIITTITDGFPTKTYVDTDVFADAQSVKRIEFYKADAAGMRADIVFVVNADEYDDQLEATYHNVRYKIVRSYRIGLDRVELTCARK